MAEQPNGQPRHQKSAEATIVEMVAHCQNQAAATARILEHQQQAIQSSQSQSASTVRLLEQQAQTIQLLHNKFEQLTIGQRPIDQALVPRFNKNKHGNFKRFVHGDFQFFCLEQALDNRTAALKRFIHAILKSYSEVIRELAAKICSEGNKSEDEIISAIERSIIHSSPQQALAAFIGAKQKNTTKYSDFLAELEASACLAFANETEDAIWAKVRKKFVQSFSTDLAGSDALYGIVNGLDATGADRNAFLSAILQIEFKFNHKNQAKRTEGSNLRHATNKRDPSPQDDMDCSLVNKPTKNPQGPQKAKKKPNWKKGSAKKNNKGKPILKPDWNCPKCDKPHMAFWTHNQYCSKCGTKQPGNTVANVDETQEPESAESDKEQDCEPMKPVSCDASQGTGVHLMLDGGRAPYLTKAYINGRSKGVSALIDPGSGYNFIDKTLYDRLYEQGQIAKAEPKGQILATTVSGDPFVTKGKIRQVSLRMRDSIQQEVVIQTSLIVAEKMSRALLLGREAINDHIIRGVKMGENGFFRWNIAQNPSEPKGIGDPDCTDYQRECVAALECLENPEQQAQSDDTEYETLELEEGRKIKVCKARSNKFKKAIVDLFNEYKDVTAVEEKIPANSKYKAVNEFKHKPKTVGRHHAFSPKAIRENEAMARKLVASGVAEWSNEPANCNLFLVKKPSAPVDAGIEGKRPVLDLRQFNSALQSDVYHTIHPKQILSRLAQDVLFSKTDIKSAYFTLIDDSRFKVVACIPGVQRNIKFIRLAQGLSTSSSHWNRCSELCIPSTDHPHIHKYVDDYAVATPELGGKKGVTPEVEDSHVDSIRRLLEAYRRSNMRYHLPYSVIGAEKIEMLNFIVSKNRIEIGPRHRDAIKQLDTRQEPARVAGFLTYFRDHIAFAGGRNDMDTIRDDVARSNEWSDSGKAALERIKLALSKNHTLAVHDFKRPLHIFVDASDSGYGYCMTSAQDASFEGHLTSSKLKREKKRQLKPLIFAAKRMKGVPSWANKSTYDRELFALSEALKALEPYISANKRTFIYVDNKAVQQSEKSRSPQIRAMFNSMPTGVQLVHVRSGQNISDILSRFEVRATPSCRPVCVGAVSTRKAKKLQKSDTTTQKILDRNLEFHMRAGHVSPERIFKSNKEIYPEEIRPTRSQVEQKINECFCMKEKIPKVKQVAPTPVSTSDILYLDFKTNGKGKILSILEPLSGYYAGLSVKNEEASSLIDAFGHFLASRGRCNTVVTDNGAAFVSGQFKSFLKELNIKHKTTCVYNPSANLSERPHSGLKRFIKLNNRKTMSRTEIITWCWSNNAMPKRRTDSSPTKVLYGSVPKGSYCPEIAGGGEPDLAKFSNNTVAESALNRTVEAKYTQLDYRRPEMLEEGTKVLFTIKSKLGQVIRKLGTVQADAGASTLIQLQGESGPKWLRKSHLSKVID